MGDKEDVCHKGQTLFPLKLSSTSVGRVYWKIDEEKRTLEMYFRGFQMGYMDGSKPEKQFKYYQSPPHMVEDNRVNAAGPPNGDVNLLKPYCDLPKKISSMEEDVHMFWQPLDTVCPPEKMKEFEKVVTEANFITLVQDRVDEEKLQLLITVASDYIQCAANYKRSYIKYSHGYDFLEAGAWLHFLLEWTPDDVVPFLDHEDLNKFKVDYIYGKETSPPTSPSSVTVNILIDIDGAETKVTTSQVNVPLLAVKKALHNQLKEEPDAAVMMVEADTAAPQQGTYRVVQGFAFIGLGSLLYGAYAHYFGTKETGDHTQLEMA